MNKTEKKLLGLLADLDKNDKHSLMAFAEFLREKALREGRLIEAEEIVPIARPDEEKVIAAIKRLTATYPMVKKSLVLNRTAALMSEHIVQGRDAVEVIDELEIIFNEHYVQFCEERNNTEE